MMSEPARKELHTLIDTLPVRELRAARRYLEFLRIHDPDEIEPELKASIDAGLDDVEKGRVRDGWQSLAEMKQRLG
ncbi:hypothetical protein KAI87_00440 [Myxococcota bacterium]|nr:hypothetical protein [Myxococcota bacterium]